MRMFGDRDVGEPMDKVWSDPYSSPPMVQAQPVGTQSSGGVLDKVLDIGRGLVDIFGRPAQVYTPPPPPTVPVWVYLAIPVALIGVVAMMRRKPSMGRYRRSRRSRR